MKFNIITGLAGVVSDLSTISTGLRLKGYYIEILQPYVCLNDPTLDLEGKISCYENGGRVPVYMWRLPVDPLVLDLNHDGQISTISLADSTAFFDLNGDKFAEHTAWIGKEDGILFLDKNGNGRVDDINEVFGGNGKDGITELSEYDENLDGCIDLVN